MSPYTFTVRKFRCFFALWVIAWAAVVGLASAATNLMVNSEFTDGTGGWGTVGTVFSTGENAILSDQGGTRVVIFQTVEVPVAGTAGLTLSFDFLNALSAQVGLGQTPDSIFGTVYTGVRPFGSFYDAGDYDVATGLVDADHRGSVNFPAGMTLSASPKGAGWVRHTVPVPVVPYVTVAFEFIEGNDTEGDSSAAFDNIFLMAEPIPEPSVAGLVFAGGVVSLIRRRRPRRLREWRQRGVGGGGSLMAGLMALALGGELRAQDLVPPLLEPSLAKASAKAERSTLDRTTAVLTSTVELEIVNTGTQRIDGPVHALIRFRDTATGAEVRSGVSIVGALGGIGRPPHQVPYFDLTPQAAGGWMPAESIGFTLVFSRARTLNVTYEVSLAGFVNAPPTLEPGGPYHGRVGEAVSFAATASDPDGDAVTVTWEFGDGATATGTETSHSFAAAGIKAIRVTADDGRSGVVEREVTAIISPSGNFALAHTRVVTGIGHPLATAIVQETGPDGTRNLTVADSGFASLGTTAGEYVWKFSAPGHQPVWRAATLVDSAVRLIPSPWLAADGPVTDVSVLESTVMDTGSGPGSVRLTFPAGAFSQPGPARLTPLGPQSLPFPLPYGWSPLTAFHLSLPETPTTPGDADLTLLDALGPGEFLTLVRFESDTQVWRTIQAATAPDPAQPTRIHFPITEPGAYAAVVRDEGTDAPIPVADGNPLPAGTSQELSTRVAAVGIVDPPQRAASLDPAAVTAQAQAVFTPATGVLPSGSWFRIGVQETYDLTDGAALRTPDYDATVYAYRRPASTVAPAESVGSSRSLGAPAPKLTAAATGEGRPVALFPLRPQFLFGPSDLTEARLHIEVLPPLGDGSAALSADGGALESADLRLTVPSNAVQGFAAGSLRALDPAAFASLAGPGQSIVRAFELNLTGLVDGSQLALTLGTPLPPNTAFTLARLTRFANGSGLTPVQRLSSDANGHLENAEPPTPPRLPGLTGAGQYLLVQLPAPQGLVTGTVVHPDTSPAPGIGARLATQPWLDITNTTGRFALLAPAGPGSALATHPSNGDGATATFNMPASLPPQDITLTLGALPPRLVTSSPTDGATKISPVTPITLEFSEKLAPTSVGANPVALRAEGSTEDLPGSATLDLSGRFLTFLPTAPLAAGLSHSLTLTADLRDLQGLALEGPRTLTFTTTPPAARGLGAQLTIYEPGAAGPTPADQALLNAIPGYSPDANSSHVAAIGSPGTADPEVPVILVNESTGATATVLSKPDGSFANFIDAEESDFISATFINANDTRITIPASKQKFDDGRIGLFAQGGILEAESEAQPAEIIVEPGAIATRTVFSLELMGLSEVQNLLGGAEPEGGGKVLGGLRYAEQGDPISLAADLTFHLQPGDIPADVDPTQATFALTIPMQLDGTVAFQVIDAMTFEPGGAAGKLVTQSPPFVGLLLRQINAIRLEAVFVDTFNRVATAGFGTAAAEFNNVGAFLVPILVAPFVGQKVAGKVVTLRSGEALTESSGVPLAGAFVRLDVGIGALGSDPPGLMRRGETFSMSDADGRFAFHMPTSFNRRLVAAHARFPFQTASSTGIPAGEVVGRTTLVFRQPPPVVANIEDTVAPTISISQSPVVVSSGQEANDGAVLTLNAVDDLQATSLVLERDAFLSTATGDVLDINRLLPPELIDESQLGAGRLQKRFRIRATEKGSALFRVHATDAAGNLATESHVVVFGDPAPTGGTAANRRLAQAWPPNGATGQALGTPIRLRFSKALEPADLQTPSWISIGPIGEVSLGSLEASPDRREITLRYFVRSTDLRRLTITFATSHVNQAPPSVDPPVASNYQIEFASPPNLRVEDGELAGGAGVVMLGGFVYSLDRVGTGGAIRVHQLLPDGTLELRQTEEIAERPNDLVAIPAYPLKEYDGSIRPAEPYLAVFSGGATDIKRLGLYRVTSNGLLVRALNARPPISLGVSQVVKAKWDPPFLAFQELTSENTSISLLNLNAFYIGFRLSQSQPELLSTLPEDGRPGFDSNHDGDFADAGETAPLPARQPAQVFGLEFSWAPLNAAERVRDFDFNADFGLLGSVFASPAGKGMNLVLGGGARLDETTARVSFPEDPKRLTFVPAVSLYRDGGQRLTDLALISTVSPDPGQRSALLVVDVSNPAAPALLNPALFPPGTGSLNTIIPRDDGLLALSTTGGGILLLDPRLLQLTTPDGLTAALLKQVPDLSGGGERSFTADSSGLGFTANGTALRAHLGSPQIEIVTFDRPAFDTADWTAGQVFDDSLATPTAPLSQKMETVLAGAQRVSSGLVFPSASSAPSSAESDPSRHYYIRVRAPGALGPTLELAAASVDAAGRPVLPNPQLAAPTFLGNQAITLRFLALAAFNAFKGLDITSDSNGSINSVVETLLDAGAEQAFDQLVRGQDAKPRYATDLVATRVTDDPTHPLYNSYLAGPIVLLGEDLTPAQHERLASDLDRRFLAATSGFWVGLSPRLDESLLIYPYASRQDEAVALSLNAGLNLRTLLLSAQIAVRLFLPPPLGDRLKAIQLALRFIDAELERTLQPGVNAYVHVGRQRNPLVFIPGIMGSELRVNGNGGKLWIDLTDLGPSLLTTSAAKLNLGADGQPRLPGVPADASHILSYVAGQDMAGSMVEFLAGTLNYRLFEFDYFNQIDTDNLVRSAESRRAQPELFPFPYDWRRDNASSAQKLARYVDLILSLHPEAENVDIVAHSMGGLVSRRFMIDHPGRVGKLVLVASPLLGASKAVYSKREGDLDDMALDLLVGRTTGQSITRYMAGLDQLMPSAALFRLGFRPVWEQGIDLDGDGFAFGALEYPDYEQFLDGSLYAADPDPRPAPIAGNNAPFHGYAMDGKFQDDWTTETSGTQLFHLVGVQTTPNTITQVHVRGRLEEVDEEESDDVALALPPVDFSDTDEIVGGGPRLPEDGFENYPVTTEAYRLNFGLELVRGAGDGTVPLLSAARGFQAGPGFDLNPPQMRVIPVVGESTDDAANKKVAHVPVLVNKITKRWVERILTEKFRDDDVPQIKVSGNFSIPEGGVTTLTAEITHRPTGVVGTPEFTWDLGDGRMLRGERINFGFEDNGDYVVTCTARFPGPESLTGTTGVAGLTSRVIRVTNRPPAPTITQSPDPATRGEPVQLRVFPGDPSPTDTFESVWTTGDGGGTEFPLTTESPILRHTYSLPGEYTVTVRVRDDEGAEGTATHTIRVREPQARIAQRAAGRNQRDADSADDDENPFDDDPAGGLEYARIHFSGVNPGEEQVRVDHDSRRVVGIFDGSVVRSDGGRAESTADEAVQLDLFPQVVSGARPNTSRVTVRALGDSVNVRIAYYKGDGQSRCFFLNVSTETGDDVVLSIPWSSLMSVPESAVMSLSDPAATVAGVIPGCQRSQLVADSTFDEDTAEISLDMVQIDQDPVEDAASDPTPTFVDDGPPASTTLGSTDPCRDLDQRLFRKMTTRRAHSATAPGSAQYALGIGPGGEASVTAGAPPAPVSSGLTEDEADEVRSAVKVIFNNASANTPDDASNPAASLFRRFVIDLSDVRILEQGTGACLWKGTVAACNGAYVKGKSDNDYELLFPSFKSPERRLDPTLEADRTEFARIAHTDSAMRGDWYFLPPRGFRFNPNSGSYRDLGAVPDYRDPEYEAFLGNVTHWGYSAPLEGNPDLNQPLRVLNPLIGQGSLWSGLGDTFVGQPDNLYLVKRGASLFGEAEGESPFENPLTPAQIISYALTKSVLSEPIVRGVLTDVSFFPFRREHFDFAIMSLEKPPPFGDDPIGDAGMGRSLLLLKWLLEGAFLPPFGGFNQGVNDVDLRAEVHQRLVSRAALLEPEAFEWGLYQEFALLSESADLRVRPLNEEADQDRSRCRPLFGDYLSAHDDKIMKKAGKAAIRGALGRLMMDSAARQSVLATTPADYLSQNFKSFEHFIEAKVRQNLALFASYGPQGTALTATDFSHILGAKVGNKPTFESIRRSPGGVDGYLLKCFSLLNQLQSDAAGGYLSFLDDLRERGEFAERAARFENAAAVQHGFTPPGGERRAGRLAMHGFPGAGDHQAHWSFVVTIRNNTGSEVGPLSIQVNGATACDNITLAPTDTALVVPNKQRGFCASPLAIEALTYTRSVARRATESIDISIAGIPENANSNPTNDSVRLEAEFLDIDAFEGPDFRLPRIKVRGEITGSQQTNGLSGFSHAARFTLIDSEGIELSGGTVRQVLLDPAEGLVEDEVIDGLLPLTRASSLVFANIPTVTVYGIDDEGQETANRLTFTTNLSSFYKEIHLRGPTEGEANMLTALRVPTDTEEQQIDAAIVLYPHASQAFAGITQQATAAQLESALGSMGVIFGPSSLAQQLIGKPLVLNPQGTVNNREYIPDPDDGHNPGRADATSSGLIVIHEDILDQARRGNLIRIEKPNGLFATDGASDRLSPAGWIRAEALHELDTRLVRAIYGTGVAGETNQFLDSLVTQLDFPELRVFRTINEGLPP